MQSKAPSPGISRDNRISDEGLLRLETQLRTGRRPSQQVLEQWVKRHGPSAQNIIDQFSPNINDKVEK